MSSEGAKDARVVRLSPARASESATGVDDGGRTGVAVVGFSGYKNEQRLIGALTGRRSTAPSASRDDASCVTAPWEERFGGADVRSPRQRRVRGVLDHHDARKQRHAQRSAVRTATLWTASFSSPRKRRRRNVTASSHRQLRHRIDISSPGTSTARRALARTLHRQVTGARSRRRGGSVPLSS